MPPSDGLFSATRAWAARDTVPPPTAPYSAATGYGTGWWEGRNGIGAWLRSSPMTTLDTRPWTPMMGKLPLQLEGERATPLRTKGMDLSVLPYNPRLEMPVVWDVPLSGNVAIQSVFGKCLWLVQCKKRGKDILRREREIWEEETGVAAVGSDGRMLRGPTEPKRWSRPNWSTPCTPWTFSTRGDCPARCHAPTALGRPTEQYSNLGGISSLAAGGAVR